MIFETIFEESVRRAQLPTPLERRNRWDRCRRQALRFAGFVPDRVDVFERVIGMIRFELSRRARVG